MAKSDEKTAPDAAEQAARTATNEAERHKTGEIPGKSGDVKPKD